MATTSTNYSGRSVDLFIFQGAKPSAMQPITMSFGAAGQITTGIQKLAQTFATLFLTERGSVALKPDQGTAFVAALRGGRINDEAKLQAEFGFAAKDTLRLLTTAARRQQLPADERLKTVKLLDFTLDKPNSKITLTVGLQSVAGSTYTLYLPVSVPIR